MNVYSIFALDEDGRRFFAKGAATLADCARLLCDNADGDYPVSHPEQPESLLRVRSGKVFLVLAGGNEVLMYERG